MVLSAFGGCVLFKKRNNTKEQKVRIETTQGVIIVKLYNETPLHRDNFLKLVNEKFYDGVLFHRVIDHFMIQAGDPDSKTAKSNMQLGGGDVGYTIPAEFRLPIIYHKKGALAAARQGDNVNPQKASSGCQFYIVEGRQLTDKELDALEQHKIKSAERASNDSTIPFSEKSRKDYGTIGGTPHLDGSYTVFGEVVEGLETVEKIAGTKTDSSDRPLDDVKILKMRLLK
ncbi:MAG: peptidylprolyl isomerase [Paludibacteraceae bacterium]